MPDRLFHGLPLAQLLEDGVLRPVVLHDPRVSAVADGAYVVYVAQVPFEGSPEVLSARPQTSAAETSIAELDGAIRGSALHLRSGPQEPSGASADAALRWARGEVRRIRYALTAMNEAVERSRAARVFHTVRDPGPARAAASRVNADLAARRASCPNPCPVPGTTARPTARTVDDRGQLA